MSNLKLKNEGGIYETYDNVESIKIPNKEGGFSLFGRNADLTPVSITENGTYTPPTGDGYSTVEVNVAGGGEPEAYLKDASVSGNALTIVKKDDTHVQFAPNIPTKTSDLTNDSGFITDEALEGYATEEYVDSHHDDAKQDILTAGKNVLIDVDSEGNTVISAEGGGSVDYRPANRANELETLDGTTWKLHQIGDVSSFPDLSAIFNVDLRVGDNEYVLFPVTEDNLFDYMSSLLVHDIPEEDGICSMIHGFVDDTTSLIAFCGNDIASSSLSTMFELDIEPGKVYLIMIGDNPPAIIDSCDIDEFSFTMHRTDLVVDDDVIDEVIGVNNPDVISWMETYAIPVIKGNDVQLFDLEDSEVPLYPQTKWTNIVDRPDIGGKIDYEEASSDVFKTIFVAKDIPYEGEDVEFYTGLKLPEEAKFNGDLPVVYGWAGEDHIISIITYADDRTMSLTFLSTDTLSKLPPMPFIDGPGWYLEGDEHLEKIGGVNMPIMFSSAGKEVDTSYGLLSENGQEFLYKYFTAADVEWSYKDVSLYSPKDQSVKLYPQTRWKNIVDHPSTMEYKEIDKDINVKTVMSSLEYLGHYVEAANVVRFNDRYFVKTNESDSEVHCYWTSDFINFDEIDTLFHYSYYKGNEVVKKDDSLFLITDEDTYKYDGQWSHIESHNFKVLRVKNLNGTLVIIAYDDNYMTCVYSFDEYSSSWTLLMSVKSEYEEYDDIEFFGNMYHCLQVVYADDWEIESVNDIVSSDLWAHSSKVDVMGDSCMINTVVSFSIFNDMLLCNSVYPRRYTQDCECWDTFNDPDDSLDVEEYVGTYVVIQFDYNDVHFKLVRDADSRRITLKSSIDGIKWSELALARCRSTDYVLRDSNYVVGFQDDDYGVDTFWIIDVKNGPIKVVEQDGENITEQLKSIFCNLSYEEVE